jgi:hypothetical protein
MVAGLNGAATRRSDPQALTRKALQVRTDSPSRPKSCRRGVIQWSLNRPGPGRSRARRALTTLGADSRPESCPSQCTDSAISIGRGAINMFAVSLCQYLALTQVARRAVRDRSCSETSSIAIAPWNPYPSRGDFTGTLETPPPRHDRPERERERERLRKRERERERELGSRSAQLIA